MSYFIFVRNSRCFCARDNGGPEGLNILREKRRFGKKKKNKRRAEQKKSNTLENISNKQVNKKIHFIQIDR